MTVFGSLSIRHLAERLRNGTATATTIANQALARRDRLQATLQAFVPDGTPFGSTARALQVAGALDAARARGEPTGPLAGVPFTHSDDLLQAGTRTGACSRMLGAFRAPTTATALTRMIAAGAVPIGATNHDEFGLGGTSASSCHGPTQPPHHAARLAGFGGAAAVAADLAILAVARDAAGAVRQGASWCGLTGLKPTPGRVSRAGLVATASSLECLGAVARRAEDLALWLDVVAGPDPADPTTMATTTREPVLPTLSGRRDLRGLRLGLPWQLNGPGLDDEVANCTRGAAAAAEHLGATLVDSSLDGVEHALAAWLVIGSAEATSNLARFDGILLGPRRERATVAETAAASRSAGFGDDVQLRLLLGSHVLGADIERLLPRARAVRHRLAAAFASAFAHCDLLLAPTTPMPALQMHAGSDASLTTLLAEALTVPANLAGLPALSMPCGRGTDGLPIGLQAIAPAGREDLLLQFAHVLQQHSDHHLQHPCA